MDSHSGNQNFCTIAREYQQEYRARQTNIEKREIVLQILARINDSGGCFLKSNDTTITAYSTRLKLSHVQIEKKVSRF